LRYGDAQNAAQVLEDGQIATTEAARSLKTRQMPGAVGVTRQFNAKFNNSFFA